MIIKINDLKKCYGKSSNIPVLNNINLEIFKGECYGFMGKNGSGKSTLLKIIAGVSYPTLGTVEIKGRILPMLEVGTGFNPELSCIENVILYNALIGLNPNISKENIKEIFKFAELNGHENKPVKFLSSGMYMRLAFSVAVNQQPDIILIDEVLAVGDGSFQKKCIKKINELKRNSTIIFVSHNLDHLKEVCDYGIVFKDGKIVYKDEITSSINYYKKEILLENE